MKVWKQRTMSWGSDCVSLLKSRNIRRSDADKEFLHRTAQCVLRPVQIEWRCVTADSLMGGIRFTLLFFNGYLLCFIWWKGDQVLQSPAV